MPFLDQLRLLHFEWRDALEIAIVAWVLYRVFLLISGTRALQMLIGIILLLAAYVGAVALKLTMIAQLLGFVFTYGALAALIILQPELRAALAHLGYSRVTRFFRRMETTEVADEILKAVTWLSRARVGAIIAIERERTLGEYLQSGSPMEARVTADLLSTIFTPRAPLHDGAVIVRGDRIIAAGCILPLSQANVADRSMGTRHRAALGLSEESDALVVVVSEETGQISVAVDGALHRELNARQVRDLIAGRPPRAAGAVTAEHGTVMPGQPAPAAAVSTERRPAGL